MIGGRLKVSQVVVLLRTKGETMITSSDKMAVVEVGGNNLGKRARRSRLLWILGACIFPTLFFASAGWAVWVMAFDTLMDSPLVFAVVVGVWTLVVTGMSWGILPRNWKAAFNKEEPIDNIVFLRWMYAAGLLVALHFSSVVFMGQEKTITFEKNLPGKIFTLVFLSGS